MKRSLLTVLGLLGLSSLGFSTYTSHTYGALITGHTGLYNASNVQTTSTVNVTNVRYTLEYDYTADSPMSPWPHYGYYNPLSSPQFWVTTIRVSFTNTNWQTAPSGSKVWVQVCNYVESYDAPTGTRSISSEVDYFQLPTVSNLVTISSTGFNVNRTFSDVNPMAIDVSSLTVDSADVTGKTGYIRWNSSSLAPAPWANLMSSPQTIVAYPNGSGTGFYGVLWAYARPTSNGSAATSLDVEGGVTEPYTVPAIDLLDLTNRDIVAETLKATV